MENSNFSILLFSSLIFITNILTTFYHNYYIYSFFFICLTISSILYHYDNNIYTSIFDKLSISAVILYGAYLLYNKFNTVCLVYISIIMLTFVLCIIIFIYGYYVNDYCYHPDKYIGDNYHFLLHCISSLGHHLITFL